MSHPLLFGFGCYLIISIVVGLCSYCDWDHAGHGVYRNRGLGRTSFLRGFIWPIYIVAVTGFLLHQNYKQWRRDRIESENTRWEHEHAGDIRDEVILLMGSPEEPLPASPTPEPVRRTAWERLSDENM